MHRDDLEKQQVALLRYIHDAFKGVTREGGVSWSEAYVIDNYGTDEERAAVCAADTDTAWTELVDQIREDPEWVLGPFSFLDAIGFRYYLAAAMAAGVQSRRADYLIHTLELRGSNDEIRSHRLAQWSALTRRQCLCVRAYIQFMINRCTVEGDSIDAEYWQKALNSYWATV